MSKFALFACLLTVVFVQYPEICKDMVSTNTPVEHGNAGGMAANGLNGMSASPTPGIQVPDDAALTISGNSNSSDSNFFQKVYQMFIASFGQDDNDSPPGTNGGKSEFVDDVSKAPTSANRSTNGPTSGDEKTSDEEINITSGSPASSQDISSAASAEQETPEVVPSASDVQKGAVKLTEEDPSNDLVGTKETLVETKDESSPNEPLTSDQSSKEAATLNNDTKSSEKTSDFTDNFDKIQQALKQPGSNTLERNSSVPPHTSQDSAATGTSLTTEFLPSASQSADIRSTVLHASKVSISATNESISPEQATPSEDGDSQKSPCVQPQVDPQHGTANPSIKKDSSSQTADTVTVSAKQPSENAEVGFERAESFEKSSTEGITGALPALDNVTELPTGAKVVPKYLEPKVVYGQTMINPTKAGVSPTRIYTKRVHGHGHSHGGHRHSHHGGHGHSHDARHGHPHDAGTQGAHNDILHQKPSPEADSLEEHSYPGEKSDMLAPPTKAPVPTSSNLLLTGAEGDTSIKNDVHFNSQTTAQAEVKPPSVNDSIHKQQQEKQRQQQTRAGEPTQYTMNTVRQTCERKDGIGCDGEPLVPSAADVRSTPAAEEKTKDVKITKRRYRDDTAYSVIREYVGLVLSVIPEPLHSLLWDLEEKGVSSHVVVLTSLCGLASSILLMFFRYMSMSSKEGALSDHIARLEQQLFALKKEREILLESRETGHGLIGDQALPDEFIQRHERELEALEGRANHAERESRHLKEVIDQLQGALRQAQESLAESENAREDYDLKQQELAEELNELRILIEENQNKAEQKDRELEEKNKALSELQESNAQILQEAEIWDQRVRELTSRIEVDSAEVTRLQKDLMEKSTDVEALKESLKNMSVLEKAQEASGNDDENDVMKRLVDVQKAQRQNEELVSKNATLQSELTDAKEQLGSWRNEIEHLKENLKQAEKDKEESERKLAVLTEYFKDKELTLQRDVVMHETLRLKKENDVLSVSEQLELYRVENVNLQTQMAAMKEEFETSERRYKRQLIDQEKKTHDNWMAFKNSSKTIEELKDETQLLRQQLLALRTEQREAAERAAAPLPQDRPRPPPPLPLPKGGQISLPPLPLPNGLKVGEMPSPPLVRYMESARHTPPAVVNLPSVLYQAKSSSSRHSSERREHQSQRRRDDDCGEGRGDRKSKTERVDRSDPHRVRDHDGDEMDLQRAERRREKREKQALLEKETSGNIACGDQHQHPRGPAETSAPDRDQSSSQLITAANGGGDGIGGVVKENGGSTCTSGRCSRIGDEWMTDQRLCKRADLDSNVGQNRIECCSDGRSIHSGGSKGGIISPELKKTSIQRRSDRGDHGDRGDRVERDRLEREHRLDRRDDRDERSPRGHRRR